MKKLKRKGEPFEELTVVRGAGFEGGKRRDKSINKKAGLHDKKVSEDETRIYRCKPLAVKHKRRLRKVLPVLLAIIAVATAIIITGSYMPPVNFDDLNGDYRTVCFETPDANSADKPSPEEHTVVETIGYLNYTLQKQPYWASEMEQSLSAMFNIKQSTYNYKKYYNNTLISVDIAKGASTSAKQFCQTGGVVLWRDAVDVNSTNGFYTNWKSGQPSGLSVSEFRKKRGLPPAEFSVYVLNEKTILNAQDKGVTSNGDGTYSVTVDLNVNTKGGEENDICSAVYYYKQQMAVTGGLSQLPTYEYTNVTYVFDENYRVLNFEINDKYEATLRIPGLGEVTSGCTSTTKTVFSYDEKDCVNSVYDDFKPYLNNFGAAGDEEPAFTVNATNCLAGAFGSVLSEGAVFKLDLGLGGKTVEGVVGVALKNGGLDSVALKLGNITAHVLNEQGGYGVYLALGRNKYKVMLGGLNLSAALDNVELPATDGEDGDLLSGLLDSLLGGDFQYDSEKGLATLNSDISLFGVDININFAFSVDEEKEEISLIDVKANIKYGNIDLDAALKFGKESDKPADLTADDKLSYKDILNDGVTVGVSLTLGDKVIDGIAKIDLVKGEFAGVRAKLGEITVHCDGTTLYIASGNNKYKLGLDALGGVSLPAGADFDINSLISGVLENLTIENGIIKANVSGLEIALDIFEGISVSAYYDAFGGIGIEAYLSSDPAPAQLTAADKLSYTDILNDGVTVGVSLTLGDKVIDGIVKIDLVNGEFVGARAKLGEITVHCDGTTLYIASGNNKYKLGLDALGGVSLPAGADFDINSLLSGVLENLTIENGIIKANVSGLDIALDIFEGISVSAYYDAFGGIGVEAYLSSDSAPAQLTEADKLSYTDILNDGVTVGVSLTLGDKVIDGIAKIDLVNGEFAGVRAKLGDAVVHYADGVIYISVSGSKIQLPISAFGGVAADVGGFDFNGLIKDILNGVHIENGIINTGLWGADISLDIFGGIKADVKYEIFNQKISAGVALAADGAPDRLTDKEKSNYVDVTQGFSLSGMLGVTLGGEQISLAVNNLAVSFENSFSFKLDAVLLLNNTYNNFGIEYLNGVLTVTYGAVSPMPLEGEEIVHNVISVRLDLLGGDLEALENAIVKVYNRIIAVYNEIAKQNVQAANGLQDILDMLGIAKDGVDGMSEIFEKLALPVKDGKLDIDTVLKTLSLATTQNGISVTLGNIFAELALNSSGVSCGATVKFGTSSFDLTISDLIVSSYSDFEVPCESPLDRYGFIELLDYLGATAEMLLQHDISLNLSGTIYDYDAAYSGFGNIKYVFNALLEYYDGGSMPVTFEDGQLYVSNDLYVHAKLDLVAQNTAEDESLYLDVYILDGHPNNTDNNGFTTGGYTADGTGLDFYVSVSKLAEGVKDYNPLKFYGSMNEVLSIASMGAAMLNLQDINTDSEKVNSAVAKIYNLLNGMLIENYIPSVKSQFASLGESLIPNILGTDLTTLLNKLIAEYESIMDSIEKPKTEITEGNFIKRAAYADGRLDVALNSATLFGVPEYEDLTFYITKTEGEHALISGLGINNIYFGDNGVNKLDLAAGITYNPVTKPDGTSAFKSYHNFDGLDKLLLTAVNSATHETTEEEKAAGYFADYKLNNDYCVDGDITLTVIGKEIPITINALHINIDENNEVSFDISISYKSQKLVFDLITDDATVDISIKKDMIYIRKAIVGGDTTYRFMPTSVFMDDMFNQLTYILSFGKLITDIADQFMSKSTEKIFPELNDYGDYIEKFINVYTYKSSGNSSEWTITANGDTLSGLAGMSGLKDIEVKFKGSNGVLNTLTLKGGLSIISFNGTLNYLNPNEKFVDGKSDLSTNLPTYVESGFYYSWSEILGGDTYAKIYKHMNWANIPGAQNYINFENGEVVLGEYKLIGASYETEKGLAVGSFAELKERGVDITAAQPIWMKYNIGYTASRSISGFLPVKYSYKLGFSSMELSFIGNEEVVRGLTFDNGYTYGYISNRSRCEFDISANRTSDYGLQFVREDQTFKCTTSVGNFAISKFTTDKIDYGHVVVMLNFNYNETNLCARTHAFKGL